ncbi:PspC domain-containing protein [Croceicoccus bisphenolivorans]|uniref:PspC domain-containing protein n=1 Tax=Croceicoccus bisphenolivorans TaxID=1783232 RepID=UPI0009ED867B|nr:PspC domain-containing protein [Croceicoccus bisphenolivorans]
MSNIDNRGGRSPRKFHLDKRDGKLMGVCAGIADYFKIDVTLVRILWVVATLAGFGSLILVYILIGLIAD